MFKACYFVNKIQAFIIALRAVINVMEVVLIIRVLCEFKAIRRDTRAFQFLLFISEPLLNPVRKILMKQTKEKSLKFDISPFVVIILLYMLNTLLKSVIS